MTGISGFNPYGSYSFNPYLSGAGSNVSDSSSATQGKEHGAIVNPGESTQVNPGRKSSPAECKTCRNRKYKDGSDEMVSYKSASHISPQASASKVRAHEQEHVSNAYKKAAKANGKVLSASVTLQTAICPECGTSYTAGGTTATKISYSNESNPYQQNRKSVDAAMLIGQNLDLAI